MIDSPDGGEPESFEDVLALDEVLFTGLFPPVHDRGLDPLAWLNGYLRTYVERDVRTVAGVGDLDAFAAWAGAQGGSDAEQLANCCDRFAVDVGKEILEAAETDALPAAWAASCAAGCAAGSEGIRTVNARSPNSTSIAFGP